MFPAADSSAIDLLRRMLQFNPNKRCTAPEALEHEYFNSVLRIESETSADKPLVCPDFLNTNNIDVAMLKRQTYNELLWYKDN